MPEPPDHNLNPPDFPECPICGSGDCPWFIGEGDVCFSEVGMESTMKAKTTTYSKGEHE